MHALTSRTPRLSARSYDNAAYEVSPPATALLNQRVSTHASSVYIAFAASAAPDVSTSTHHTARSLRSKAATVAREVAVHLFSLCVRLGGGSYRSAACERMGLPPDEWKAHDGLLSVAGQRTPMGEPSVPLPSAFVGTSVGKWADEPGDPKEQAQLDATATADANEAKADGLIPDPCPPQTPSTADVCAATVERALERVVSGESLVQPQLERGVWHAHELEIDHFSVCGGPLASPKCIDAFWDMYCRRLRPAF